MQGIPARFLVPLLFRVRLDAMLKEVELTNDKRHAHTDGQRLFESDIPVNICK